MLIFVLEKLLVCVNIILFFFYVFNFDLEYKV